MKDKSEYLLAFLVVLDCNTIFSRSGLIRVPIWFLFVFMFIVYNMAFNTDNWFKDKKNMKKIIVNLLIYLAIVTIPLIFTRFINNNTIKVLFVLFPLLYIFVSMEKESRLNILKKIPTVMFYMCILSLVVWLIGPILNILKPTNNIVLDWGTKKIISSYYYIHFITQTTHIFGIKLIRNTGIFTEAPMFSLLISISLITELFISKKFNLKKVIVFIVTTISTFSTTGFLIAVISLLLYALYNKRAVIKKIHIVYKIALVLVVLIISLLAIAKKMSSVSYSTRVDDYKASIVTFAQKPLFGSGYGNESAIRENMSEFRLDNTGLSNSIFVLLAQLGIFAFAPLVYLSVKKIKKYVAYRKYNLIIFYSLIFILLLTMICIYQIIFVYLLILLIFDNNTKKRLDFI